MSSPLAYEHNLLILERFQKWRRGDLEGTMDELGLTPKIIGDVLDWAIEELGRKE